MIISCFWLVLVFPSLSSFQTNLYSIQTHPLVLVVGACIWKLHLLYNTVDVMAQWILCYIYIMSRDKGYIKWNMYIHQEIGSIAFILFTIQQVCVKYILTLSSRDS